jgi:hypothetical protein
VVDSEQTTALREWLKWGGDAEIEIELLARLQKFRFGQLRGFQRLFVLIPDAVRTPAVGEPNPL